MRNPRRTKRGKKYIRDNNTKALNNFGNGILGMDNTDDVDFDEINEIESKLKRYGF